MPNIPTVHIGPVALDQPTGL